MSALKRVCLCLLFFLPVQVMALTKPVKIMYMSTAVTYETVIGTEEAVFTDCNNSQYAVFNPSGDADAISRMHAVLLAAKFSDKAVEFRYVLGNPNAPVGSGHSCYINAVIVSD